MTPGQYILVVDDDDDFREALSEVLAEAGYPVQQAENGEERAEAGRRRGARDRPARPQDAGPRRLGRDGADARATR